MKAHVLLVDDDPVDQVPLRMLLESWGHVVTLASNGREAVEAVASQVIDVVLTDVVMPVMDGRQLLSHILASEPGLPVVMLTGKGSIRAAVDAMKAGAFDYVPKPPVEDDLRFCVERAVEFGRLRRENARLRSHAMASGRYGDHLLGRSPAMLQLFETIDKIARTDSTVLLTGETGTGKELVAQTIHFKSRRSAGPWVAFNCAAVSAGLAESELFGHEKGAFTGAVASRRGRFEDADGGTIFLDEIGETSPEFQAKLLRVLQERSFERVGGSRKIDVDVRVIAATNADLREMVRKRLFREDLYYRLCVIPVSVPPLRERREDILLLAGHFATQVAARYALPAKRLSVRAEDYLAGQPWPGNVRELQHAVERAVILSESNVLEPRDFIFEESARAGEEGDGTLQDCVDRATRDCVTRALDRCHWQKQRAAELLGVDRVTLYRLLKKFTL